MPIDDATQAVVRALWEAGARHGRAPAPVPEADPWEDDAQGAGHAALVVVLAGTPDLEVHLHRDGHDEVEVENGAYLDVPRRDTVAVVEALLGGGARRRPRVRGFLGNLVAIFLDSPAPSDLEVRVGEGDAARTYRAQITATQPVSAWLMSRPVADD
ncbi:hypothetical protein [Cellulomonas pakistanensis]|uniref:Uncharacterized protein n=1 Tax=Cellulomonas pakistanensis TaxID=992287 RepID=A0A919U6N7_9CELL|nr:hypothetical protein [Cellulomonas pakistanensis]GIG37194.1 hypothetical protein Cpa01nite_25750 [Cellulomonas pakistanensis]